MENRLSAEVLSALQNRKNVRVPFNTFKKIFQYKDDIDFTAKLLKFANINGLDYVIIFNQTQGPMFVRFWLKKVEERMLPDTNNTDTN